MQNDHVNVTCPICQKEVTANVLLWSHDVCCKLEGEFAVVKCELCDFVMSYPEMSEQQLGEYYPSDYYGDTPQVQTPKEKENLLRLGRQLYRMLEAGKRTNKMALYHRPSAFDLALPACDKPGKLLDVGAGWGTFLSGALGMGWSAEGVDFSPEIKRVGEALDIPVFQGSLASVQKELSDDYVLISMNHVLEHLDNPLQTLKLAHHLLAHGGVLRVQIPMWRPTMVSLFGVYWFPLDLPRHRWHFRVEDVRELARLAGFKKVMFIPETGTHPIQSSLRMWVRDHPKFHYLERFTSVDNRIVRLLLLPLGWILAAVGKPLEATFYMMAEKEE